MTRRQQFYRLLNRIKKVFICQKRQQNSNNDYDQLNHQYLTDSYRSTHKLDTIKEQSNDYEITFGTEEDEDKKPSKFNIYRKVIQKPINNQLFNKMQHNEQIKRNQIYQTNRDQQQNRMNWFEQQYKPIEEVSQNNKKILMNQLDLIQKTRDEEQNMNQIDILDIKDNQFRNQPTQIHSEIQKVQDQVYRVQFLSRMNREDEKRNQSLECSRLDLTDIKNQMSSVQNSQQSLEELVDFIK